VSVVVGDVAGNHRANRRDMQRGRVVSVILRNTGCGPARRSKADALARVATTRIRGASKDQPAPACLGTQAEEPRFQDGILESMLGHPQNPSPTSSTRDLPAATRGEHRFAGNREFLVGDRICFETRPTKDRRVFRRKVLVDFELQALISSGKSTVPSLTNTAACRERSTVQTN
jgi:hypothetical protein